MVLLAIGIMVKDKETVKQSQGNIEMWIADLEPNFQAGIKQEFHSGHGFK